MLRICINNNGFELVTGIVPIEDPNEEFEKPNTLNEHIKYIKMKKENLFSQKNKPDIIPEFC